MISKTPGDCWSVYAGKAAWTPPKAPRTDLAGSQETQIVDNRQQG